MVKIRLVRLGAKKRPFYRIVAIDEREKRSGRPLEFLGTYDPTTPDRVASIRTEAADALGDGSSEDLRYSARPPLRRPET